ncbi:MAG: 4-hydroxy-3-methylbut-2-enyl diphosphate reductase [Planctomycetota bacterium]|nr:4-hydroxy-3-methylbut-2-enyl diphosphate reductase [Planctomycetota bacterium]MDG1983359.1 4-hydroxy-3-methylbut-2-enyl diphosphate reductase [Planctomycetota bacterium]
MTSDVPANQGEEVVLANPRGFCAGVDRAIQIVERALEVHGAPVFVLHEIVHNKHVLERLRDLGARFVSSLDEVPEGSVTVFSAHGVSDAVVEKAAERRLEAIDATCPLVTKVHRQAIRYEGQGREVILVGHPGHPEVEGTRGRIKGKVHVLSTPEEVQALHIEDPEQLAYVTQTTLSVDDTKEVIEALLDRFPTIQGPALKDICYATQNRQTAVKDMIGAVDTLIVVGSENSSNSNRLRELGERGGVPAYLVDHPDQVRPEWVAGAKTVGVTAGASAPEELVQLILTRLDELGVTRTRELDGEKETVVFQMPEGL